MIRVIRIVLVYLASLAVQPAIAQVQCPPPAAIILTVPALPLAGQAFGACFLNPYGFVPGTARNAIVQAGGNVVSVYIDYDLFLGLYPGPEYYGVAIPSLPTGTYTLNYYACAPGPESYPPYNQYYLVRSISFVVGGGPAVATAVPALDYFGFATMVLLLMIVAVFSNRRRLLRAVITNSPVDLPPNALS